MYAICRESPFDYLSRMCTDLYKTAIDIKSVLQELRILIFILCLWGVVIVPAAMSTLKVFYN